MDSLLEKRSISSKSEEQSESSLDKRRRVLRSREDISAIGEIHLDRTGRVNDGGVPELVAEDHAEDQQLEKEDNLEAETGLEEEKSLFKSFDYNDNATNEAVVPEPPIAAADDSEIEEYEEDLPVLCIETDEKRRTPRRRSPRRYTSKQHQHPRVPFTVTAQTSERNSSPDDAVFDSDLLSALLLDELSKDDPLEVARALDKLGSVLKHSEDGTAAEQTVALGGHSVLVLTMKHWPRHEPIQRHACHCIFRMIGRYYKRQKQSTEGPVDLVESFLVLGVVDEIVHALRVFPESSELQVFGIGALGNVLGSACGGVPSTQAQTSNTGNLARRAAARKFVRESRGVALVVDAMRMFPEHAKLQELGCWVCACLCLILLGSSSGSSKAKLISKTAARVMKCEALVAVSTAVQNYPDNRSIEKQAACFMASLFRSSR